MKATFKTDSRVIARAIEEEMAASEGQAAADQFRATGRSARFEVSTVKHTFGAPHTKVTGNAQAVMYLIGRVAAMGEDGLVAVE